MSSVRAADLDVLRLGDGPPIVFVHGTIVGAETTWRRQLPLAERFSLVIANRPGFGASPPLERGDFELEAPLVAELLGDGAHLVGHSYGAVIALLAAAQRPEAVLSLTVSEPGALKLAETPEAEEMIANGERLFAAREAISPADFLRYFRGGAGSSRATPAELSDELLRGAELAMAERPSWEADVPLDELAAAGFPVLAISGGHSPVFEAVSDALAERLGAERSVIQGKGHNVPETGEPYNERLARFLTADPSPGPPAATRL
jgi:pimeloyl-ACP methyl ester carboxylesterase